MINNNQIIVPFLKWAGGKRWLVTTYPEIFPKKFKSYFEPFLGSGAIYFHLRPNSAVLSDVNRELINTYKAIRDNWRLVYRYLTLHHNNHTKSYYYKIRSTVPVSLYKAASRFIYLNRACWNGLYRVNIRGEFNVPIGTKTRILLPSDNFGVLSKFLSKATICNNDFAIIVNRSKRGDFIFVDPPYTVKHNLNGFVKYNEQLFSWPDQERLFECLCSASKKGVKILMTNADHESIRKLYRNHFDLISLRRPSIIAANSNFRQTTTELVITNY
jgi:DNA adenine methylase